MTENVHFSVLVVEDDKASLTTLNTILKDHYRVLTAIDGVSAVKIAQEAQPDLILLDIILPELSGFDVLKKLKESDLTRHIPVIIITGLTDAHEEEKGLRLGAVDYVTKPFYETIIKLRVGIHLKIVEQMRTIEQIGMLDALTGIPNRRGFDYRLSLEWHRGIRDQSSLGLLMLDLDHFKAVNDRHGHAHGDTVLKRVAEVLSKAARRSTDFTARWGGEEFMVLLPDTSIDGVAEVAEKIREQIEIMDIPNPDGGITRVTVSIGIHAEMPDKHKDMEELVFKADKALYQAKEAGRNRVVRT